MARVQQEQRLLTFAQAQASAVEILQWRTDLIAADGALESAKETLEKSQAWRTHDGAKDRVKELRSRIAEAEAALVDGIAEAAK